MLNDYQSFYRNQSQAYGGTYINMRAQYLKEIPDFRGRYIIGVYLSIKLLVAMI